MELDKGLGVHCWRLVLIIISFFISTALKAEQAYISWVEVDSSGESHIYVFVADSTLCLPWQQITQSFGYLATPVISYGGDGQIFASWKSAAADFESSEIEFSVYQGKQWSLPQAAISSQGEVTNPAMITDGSGVTLLFWVSDQSGSDDVYFSLYDARSARWGEPEQVNKRNDVPDIKPRVQLRKDGAVVLDWQQYDPIEGHYQNRSRVFDLQSPVKRRESTEQQLTVIDITFPMLWRPSGSVNIHFPSNLENKQLHLSRSQALAYSPLLSGQ